MTDEMRPPDHQPEGYDPDRDGALLSGYIDGELTQQMRQRVEVLCRRFDDARNDLEALRAMRERLGQARLSELGEDRWRETMEDSTVKATRTVGWMLFVAAVLILGALVVVSFLSNPGIGVGIKLLMVGFYGGLAVLLFSVLRQRLIEQKTDRYKDVDI